MSQFKGKAPTHNVGSRQEFRGNSEPAPGQLRRTGTTYIEGSTWENLSILSLDGGGIRGYWTLRVLEMLMYHIGEWEGKYAKKNSDGTRKNRWEGLHSFWPEEYPPNVSHVPPTGPESSINDQYEQYRDERDAHDASPENFRRWQPSRRYLPCHYFDYIAGTSTGGLIAIMLGRFRMTVKDCLEEYRTLGDRVFGNPRKVHKMKPIPDFVGRDKFDAQDLKDVFQDFTYRRAEKRDKFAGPVTFPTRPGVCKALVASIRSDSQDAVATTYFIRSYRHLMEQEKIPNRISSPIAFGEAQNFKIWEVARAATAAPTIFEPIKIKHQPNSANGKLKEYHTFSDGGFMGVNNPTMEVYREVEKRHGTQNGATISIVVSIGTARAGPRRFNTSVRGTARFAVDETTGTDRVAADMEELANRTPELRYFRLNATKKGCKVQLDEWKPRGVKARLKNQHPGSETLKSIDETFDTWYNETPSNGEKSNRQQISECAERLVKIRRARMKERSRWERYATCAHYYCDEVNCEAEFQYRHLFEKHLSEHNGTDAEEATPALYKEDNEDIEQDVGSEHGEGINEAITPTRSRQVQMDECRKRWEYPRKLGPNEGRYG